MQRVGVGNNHHTNNQITPPARLVIIAMKKSRPKVHKLSNLSKTMARLWVAHTKEHTKRFNSDRAVQEFSEYSEQTSL